MPTRPAIAESGWGEESAYPDPLNLLVRWLIQSEVPEQERGLLQVTSFIGG